MSRLLLDSITVVTRSGLGIYGTSLILICILHQERKIFMDEILFSCPFCVYVYQERKKRRKKNLRKKKRRSYI